MAPEVPFKGKPGDNTKARIHLVPVDNIQKKAMPSLNFSVFPLDTGDMRIAAVFKGVLTLSDRPEFLDKDDVPAGILVIPSLPEHTAKLFQAQVGVFAYHLAAIPNIQGQNLDRLFGKKWKGKQKKKGPKRV